MKHIIAFVARETDGLVLRCKWYRMCAAYKEHVREDTQDVDWERWRTEKSEEITAFVTLFPVLSCLEAVLISEDIDSYSHRFSVFLSSRSVSEA